MADVKGFDEAEAKLASAPSRLRKALVDATKDAVDVVVGSLRANTPVYARGLTLGHGHTRSGTEYPPGSLLAGWRTRVVETAAGAQGIVSNRVYYRLFVERGSHPHRPMRAQPFTERGVAQVQGTVNGIYESQVEQAVIEIS